MPNNIEFYVPPNAEVIFVEDFFVDEILGGAEMTSDAIIQAADRRVCHLHSRSLTERLVKAHRAKKWVFGNQTQVPPWILNLFLELNIEYHFFEYDYKPCIYRSTKKHESITGKPCDCTQSQHGQWMSYWMTGAKTLFWCSGKQRDKFYGEYPHLIGRTRDFVQGSTFYPDTIKKIRAVREQNLPAQNHWCILDSDSWIKGTSDAVDHCNQNGMKFVLLKNLSNEDFLKQLSSSKGLVFFPRDIDVGSRITVESKLLGREVILNPNVLVQYEPWFSRSLEEIEEYFLDGPTRFWKTIHNS